MIALSKVPTNPGCYIYKDFSGTVIYVGKAKNLRKRVSSYFQKKDHDAKTAALVRNIHSAEFIITDTENEALLLENNLIKKHGPKYNIDLKDSRRYAYLLVTDEKFPRLLVARDRKEKGQYFGPFTSGIDRDYIQKFLVKTFKIRTCRKLPKRECLRFHIGLCPAPCTGRIDEIAYKKSIMQAVEVLKGKTSDVIVQLKKEMESASNKLQYEVALNIRNQIDSLSWLEENQKVERKKKYNEDIINYFVTTEKTYLMLFNIHNGILENRQEYEFENTPSEDVLEQFLVQHYDKNTVPKEIIIPHRISASVVSFLDSKRKDKIIITVPKIGEKKNLLELVQKNIEGIFLKGQKSVEVLRKELKLNSTPRIIECFDISHLSGTFTVASMVKFKDGHPDKKEYRRFKIRTVIGIDDFSSIAEVVRRRYAKLVSDEAEMPDLIVIDGGKGQLHFALQELHKLRVRVPIISLAKKFEEIYEPGNSKPIILDRKSEGLKLLQKIRDEAHRFAITYNRLLRQKEIK